MKNINIIVTRPGHDVTTSYLQAWSQEIVDTARAHGFVVNDLKNEKANKKIFEQTAKSMCPRMIVLNGHGGPDQVCGHNNEVVVKSGENEGSLKLSIVYTRSCETAQKLGKKSIEAGAEAYIGYENEFVFLTDQNKTSRPLSDEIAKPFFDVSNAIAKTLIKGMTVKKAIENSDVQLVKKIEYYKAHYSLEASAMIFFLSWNSNCRKVFGNENAIL